MELGGFSVSLAVKDLEASRSFYEKLGFKVYAGQPEHGFLIMKNGDTNIGLFQGMFEGNILTFNPGWDTNADPVETFTDVRELYKKFTALGIEIERESITGESGRASFGIVDPDGNSILFDQHV
ncbi:MAG: VOC family protein [Xanthomonadales bacterium]|nr:VOC family protein [Xanthomonadales bacterium]